MFDASMGELILVFVIGLLILGPERLPRVAAQIGRWVAKARRTANQLRYQLEREVALEEMYKAQKKKPRPASKSTGAETSAEPKSSASATGSTEPSGSDTPGASGAADAGTGPESHDAPPAPARGAGPAVRPEEPSTASSTPTSPTGAATQPDDGGRAANWSREAEAQDLAGTDVTEAAAVRESSAR